MKSSLFGRALLRVFGRVNRDRPWHALPVWASILNLLGLRIQLRERNLHDTWPAGALRPRGPEEPLPPEVLTSRRPDGSYNDLGYPDMGKAGTRFGRNVPREHTFPDPEPQLLDPSPREISRKLLARDEFVPATTLNLLAAAWIQFQTHDWFNHGRDLRRSFEIPVEDDDDWFERPMRVPRTPADPNRSPDEKGPPTFVNTVSHWWDASGIYGSDLETQHALRTHEDGKLITEAGRLPIDPKTRMARTGFGDNWWLGLSLLHNLFTLEHNAICDRLKAEYPDWTDERLFCVARLVNAALMAKIHTVEWTPAITAHPTLQIGMRANWWGLAEERVHRLVGRLSRSEVISGIPGSPAHHHGAPYQLTEEFVAVYRLHPLIPDEIVLHRCSTGEQVKRLDFRDVVAEKAERVVGPDVTMADAFYSFGVAHPGAVTLHNYPAFLRDIQLTDGSRLDLAAVDVLRDRERGIPRYNQFRRLLHLPPADSFEALTDNPVWAQELSRVYKGDIERVDLMVGMFAETPPPGFGFSDTAFRVFILMASRRLKSDRFFTDDFRPGVYTKVGMKWIADNDMRTVLLRHFPQLGPTLRGSDNAFAPWRRLAAAPAAAPATPKPVPTPRPQPAAQAPRTPEPPPRPISATP